MPGEGVRRVAEGEVSKLAPKRHILDGCQGAKGALNVCNLASMEESVADEKCLAAAFEDFTLDGGLVLVMIYLLKLITKLPNFSNKNEFMNISSLVP